jgi:hypothetical protein
MRRGRGKERGMQWDDRMNQEVCTWEIDGIMPVGRSPRQTLKRKNWTRPTGALDGIPNDFGTLQHVSKNFEELQSPYYQYSLKLEVTTWCVIVIVAGQKSNCPGYSRFSYQTASVSETKNPSSNVLVLCPTSSCSAVIWKYVLHRHFKECHPGLPQSVYDAQVISATEKGLLKVLWDNRHMKTQRKSKKSKQKKGIEHQQRVIAHEFSRSRSVFWLNLS